jgi:hypothetical protein
MWLEAMLTEDDLTRIAGQLFPLEVRLKGGGQLRLEHPHRVTLVPSRGVQVECDARLVWPILGVGVPLELRSLTVSMLPVVEVRAEGYALVIRPGLDHAGVSRIGLIEERTTAMLNEELQKHRIEWTWHFGRTLNHTFSLPGALKSVDALDLKVRTGAAQVTPRALRLEVSMVASVHRSTREPESHA